MYILKTSHRSRRLAIATGVVILAAMIAWLWNFATFRLFFAWPDGGTWSNTIAWLEDAAISSLVVWAFRNHVGRRLAKWWDELTDPHLQTRLDDHKEKVVEAVTVKLDEHHEQIIQTINGHLNNGNGHDAPPEM
jgi:hypothetical protein